MNQPLLPDEVPASAVLSKTEPLLREISNAVCAYYQLDHLDQSAQARGLLIVIARRFTRVTNKVIGELLSRNPSTVTSAFVKTVGRLDVNELLRDDRDIIERRIAEMVIERSGGVPCH